jgi:hypothetical protein
MVFPKVHTTFQCYAALRHQPVPRSPTELTRATSGASINLLGFCYVPVREFSSSPMPFAMEEAASQDGRKRRLTFEPASERGSDKRHRTCCHGEDCELTTKVLAQESTIRNLAGVVEDILGRLAALEQPPSAISIDHTRTKSSKRQSCPADNCTKAFDRTDHLHRHIRGIYDEPHLSLTRVLDQKYCVLCKKDFKRPCDLVRHEKSFYDETYISRAYKFASHLVGLARAPTPPDTSLNASTDWDDPASE